MLGIELVLLFTILSTVPLFLMGGLLFTRILYAMTGEKRNLFSPSKSRSSDFSEFGGPWPTISGAMFGIAVGSLMETFLILTLAASVVLTNAVGIEAFLRGSAFAVLIGIGCAVEVSEWAEHTVRKSDVYRGYR